MKKDWEGKWGERDRLPSRRKLDIKIFNLRFVFQVNSVIDLTLFGISLGFEGALIIYIRVFSALTKMMF